MTVLGTAALLATNPLDPPAGPAAPTFKTLSEVEPRVAINASNTPGDGDSVYRIAAPGSYYLTGNVEGVAGKSGIEIAADHVVIDLMGFTVRGAQESLHGFAAESTSYRSVVVRNGVVREWGGNGVNFGDGVVGVEAIIEYVRVMQNEGNGIVTGPRSEVRGCAAEGNVGSGLIAGAHGVVERSAFTGNAIDGVLVRDSSVVRDCTAGLNGRSGIRVVHAGLVTGCVSHDNTFHGITGADDSRITECTVHSNGQSGIVVNNGCLVLGNNCSSNGSGAPNDAGVQAIGGANRIEGNLVRNNTKGLCVLGNHNLIRGNSATGNATNYFIQSNNRFGPVQDLTGVGGSLVNGNSGASSLGTSHPGANFAY